jgi:hypothetical protein
MATTIDSRAETVSLIGSDKVQGTSVYGADDKKIGSVQRVMIDKVSGKVAYAVVSFGGFLGLGEDYYPLPWPLSGIGAIGRGIARFTTTTGHRSGTKWRDQEERLRRPRSLFLFRLGLIAAR